MKTLQNNFTTPEQSKRLLELGVPADSADMWWVKDETIRINGEWVHGADWDKVPSHFGWDRDNNRFYTYSETKESVEDFTGNETLPCWSVGRLQEIFAICFTGEPFKMWHDDHFYLPENIVGGIEEHINDIDFSKLEE